MTREIKLGDLRDKIDCEDGFVLVGALSEKHYASSHLPGAVNLPYEFVDEAEKVLPDKDAEIVVYCMNTRCESSREESRESEEIGYTNVIHFAEGKQAWMQAGLPVEGKHAKDDARGDSESDATSESARRWPPNRTGQATEV